MAKKERGDWKKKKLQTDWWNTIKNESSPSACSSLLSIIGTAKSCCLWNWQAAAGRVFDLSRNHHDALNWYRFVPYRCRSRWYIWSTVPEVNLSLGGASVPSACHLCPRGENKHLRREQSREQSLWIYLQDWIWLFLHMANLLLCKNVYMLLPNISQSYAVYIHHFVF